MGLEKKIRNALLTAGLAVLTGCAYPYIKATISGESVSFTMKDKNKVDYTFILFCSITKPGGGEPVAKGFYTKNPDESYENVLDRCMEDNGFVRGFIINSTSNSSKEDTKIYPTDKEIRIEQKGKATITITAYNCAIKEYENEKGLEPLASTLCIPKSYVSSATNVVTFPSPTTSAQPAQPQTPNKPSGTVVILPFPKEKSQMPRPQYPQGPTTIINNYYYNYPTPLTYPQGPTIPVQRPRSGIDKDPW